MKRLKEIISIAFPLAILALVLLVMFEVVTFPNSHRWMGYFVAGYLALVLVLLVREIVRDAWRWLRGDGNSRR